MSAAFGVVAFLVALAGLLVTLGNAGYLAMLSSAAKGKGISGEPTADYVRGRRQPAGIMLLVALIGLAFTSGGPIPDLIGIILGAGSGLAASRALGATRKRFHS
ncbi:MAG TPA: hypothetical protein VL595_11980 [Pseudonocardia sp.]|jgi:hypothetical protein|nr:hypothetical protein [Pseudonocardia sp.]